MVGQKVKVATESSDDEDDEVQLPGGDGRGAGKTSRAISVVQSDHRFENEVSGRVIPTTAAVRDIPITTSFQQSVSDFQSLLHEPRVSTIVDKSQNVTWTIILLCTDRESFMKQCNPYGNRCNIVEITELDDFTSEAGYQKVVSALKQPNVVIFASLPCTCLLYTSPSPRDS